MSLPGFTAETTLRRPVGTYRTTLNGSSSVRMPRVTAQLQLPDRIQRRVTLRHPVLLGDPYPVLRGDPYGIPWQECHSCTCITPYLDVLGEIQCCSPPFGFSLGCTDAMQRTCQQMGGAICFPVYL